MRAEFLDRMCATLPFVILLFATNVVLLVLLALSFLVVEPGSASYYVGILALAIIGATLTGTGLLIRKCRVSGRT